MYQSIHTIPITKTAMMMRMGMVARVWTACGTGL